MIAPIEGKKPSEAVEIFSSQVASVSKIVSGLIEGNIVNMTDSQMEEALQNISTVRQNGKSIFRTLENRLAFSESVLKGKLRDSRLETLVCS